MPHNTLFHQVLAHETGHKVSLSHTTRGASWVVYAAGGIDALTPATFTQNPTSLTTFFNRFLTYDFHGRADAGETVRPSVHGLYRDFYDTSEGEPASAKLGVSDGRSAGAGNRPNDAEGQRNYPRPGWHADELDAETVSDQ